jgi:hypothetical protein
MKVNNLHEFDDLRRYQICVNHLRYEIGDHLEDRTRMDWILSLDVSSLTPMRYKENSILNIVRELLPELREINLSNIYRDEHGFRSFSFFDSCCPHLEKVTWNNISFMDLDRLHIGPFQNLKEIIMDDSTFVLCKRTIEEIQESEEEERRNFEHGEDEEPLYFGIRRTCSKVLERLSIRNAKIGYLNTPIPQNTLIKFVRNSPASLRWFRSDLTQDNMTMLRLERPEIEFLN